MKTLYAMDLPLVRALRGRPAETRCSRGRLAVFYWLTKLLCQKALTYHFNAFDSNLNICDGDTTAFYHKISQNLSNWGENAILH